MGKWSQEQHSHPESSLTVTVQLHCIRRQKFTQESIAVTVPELQQYNSSTVTFPTFFFILTSPSIISDSISSPNYWFFFCFVFVYIALRKIKSFVLKTWRNLRPFGFTSKKHDPEHFGDAMFRICTVCGVWARLKIDKSLLMKDKSSSRKHTNPFSSEEASLLNDISSSKFNVL